LHCNSLARLTCVSKTMCRRCWSSSTLTGLNALVRFQASCRPGVMSSFASKAAVTASKTAFVRAAG
jgi:hypothetical protein